MRRPQAARMLAAGALTVLISVVVSSCAAGAPMPVPTYTPTSSASATAAPAPPVDPTAQYILRPGGTAAANQLFFDRINQAFFDAHGVSDGRSIIDNLVAAGFIKADMELTPDQTAIGVAADSIVFSVRIKSQCLVGQFAPSGYVGALVPLLGTGRCLVGTTRPIDW